MKLSSRGTCVFLALFFLLAVAFAKKDSPSIVMYWPGPEKPSLKLTFAPFQKITGFGKQITLFSDVTIENVSGKPIPRASFTVYMLDKDKIRVGNGVLVFDDLTPGASARVQFQCQSVGTPVNLSLVARRDAEGIPNALKMVPLKIISVPEGAKLTVDGRDEGMTPALVNLNVGMHKVELSKDGFAPATTPVDVKPDEIAGGSITIELGGLSQDTIELRDGTILIGDAISMTLTDVVVRVDGKETKYDRNQVRKISMVQRINTEQQPAVMQPIDAKTK